MKKETVFRWLVQLGQRSVYVRAADKMAATKEAAVALGVDWKKNACQMDASRLGRG